MRNEHSLIKIFPRSSQNFELHAHRREFFHLSNRRTQQIRNLEENINLKLFKRTKQYVELTPAGQSFFFDVQELINKLEKAVDKARTINLGVKGTLSVGFFIGFSQTPYIHS